LLDQIDSVKGDLTVGCLSVQVVYVQGRVVSFDVNHSILAVFIFQAFLIIALEEVVKASTVEMNML